ncbi:hypothetical protein H2200_010417 [Cladophialophora chaetospira]|uniref:F-box domain-containing protein n=1 Tax=Cladophialophora chaetospira TaxID=386627 RepID=A0AA38X1E7_9EURO|nr:hypothetical protein H2200_010417 [Cladophialophora chaetospira]
MDSSQPPAFIGQVLGKRKYGGHATMKVSSQSRNAGGSFSQVFSQKPLTTQFSIETARVSEHVPQPTPRQIPSRSAKKARLGEHTFVTSTVATMKNGERPTLKRATTTQSTFSETSSINSDQPTKPGAKPPRFRPSRPLQIADSIYPDVWIRIFSFCDPKFLLEARTIDKHRSRLLSEYSMIWMESRINHYGSDMPACPKGLTEKKYVELLAGRGCQNAKCSKGETQKVHWLFQLRLCTDCFAEKTMRVDELSRQRQHSFPDTGYEIVPGEGLALWELLPLARLDGRRDSQPLSVDENRNSWARNQGNPRQFRFLKSAYSKLESEYLELKASEPDDEAIRAWTDNKHKELMESMIDAIKLESWCKEHIYHKQTTEAQDLRQTRTEYFEARALELSPPMERRVLHKMADFNRLLKVRQQPTDRTWETLRKKIEPYRSHAMLVLEFERLMDSFPERLPELQAFKQLHEHRNGRKGPQPTYRPEQRFVLRLGQAEYNRCVENGVADEDLLLLCLKNVFDIYTSLDEVPVGLNFDGTTGPYRLSLDDARMIVEEVLEKQIPRNSPRGRIVFQSLRCRGCRRNDHVKTFSFVEAFEHILEKHAREVGEGLEFYQFALPYPKVYSSWNSPEEGRVEFKFPWYTVFWPKSLPLVPRHQVPSELKHWHPAVPTEFKELEEPTKTSAFEGRRPCDTENPDDAFALNLVYAAEKLYGLEIDGPCQLKIALKFAIDRYVRKQGTGPAISKFTSCLDGIRSVNPKIDLKFGCGVCVAEEKVHRSARQSKYRKTVDALEKHWASRHQGGAIAWTEGMMQLPSESEVLQHILSSDKKLRAEQEALRQREATRHNDIKKRAHAKANVVLQQRAAGDVLDELFPRED